MSEGTHIRFADMGKSDSGKTHVWAVVEKQNGEALGVVKWYGPWRGYCFWPKPWEQTIFEQVCLREIADFIVARTAEHRQSQ